GGADEAGQPRVTPAEQQLYEVLLRRVRRRMAAVAAGAADRRNPFMNRAQNGLDQYGLSGTDTTGNPTATVRIIECVVRLWVRDHHGLRHPADHAVSRYHRARGRAA